MVTATSITREAPYLEDFRRRLLQGGFDLEHSSGFYAGVWGSNVNFNNGAGSELDLYLGYGFEMGGVGVDVGYISYEYIDSDPDATFDETYVGLSMGCLLYTSPSPRD